MASERQMQFRVGVFVLVAFAAAGTMIFQFGELHQYFEDRYPVTVRLTNAAGLHVNTPVQMYGLTVGEVRAIRIDPERGNVVLTLAIDKRHMLPRDSTVRVTSGLLGGAGLQIVPGKAVDPLSPGAELVGASAESPFAAVERMESRVNESLANLEATSEEWKMVAANINMLLEDNRKPVDEMIAKSLASVEEFGVAMQAATRTLTETQTAIGTVNEFLSDPVYQGHLKKTVETLPVMVQQTTETLAAAQSTLAGIDRNLKNLEAVTSPIANRSETYAAKLESTLANLDGLTGQLNAFSQLLTKEDGSLNQLASSPELYRNLNMSAASLSILLTNLQPIMKDMRVFSDKIARHPELLGVGGAMRGSSGIKDAPVQPASYNRQR